MELKGTQHIDWMYPNIYSDKPLDSITINMMHVRSSSAIQIEYDGDRDGYVIRMDRTKEGDGMMEVLEQNQEVAFIPAWNEELKEKE